MADEQRSGEVVLLTDTYPLSTITTPESRSKLTQTLLELDQTSLSEWDLRRYFEGMKLVVGAFIQRVGLLESSIVTLRNDQVAMESRMEAMYLKAQLEIQELRSEISEIRLSKGRINQIVKVAKALQGNAYAPYAVKSLVDGVVGRGGSSNTTTDSTTSLSHLPKDFNSRLEFAQQNGFKWNKNNRVPTKSTKQLKLLEEWENQFLEVEKLTTEEVLDKSRIAKLGAGAVAGALMVLERELGTLLPERKTHSVFNCYQKAIKMYQDRAQGQNLPAQMPCVFDVKNLLLGAFFTAPLSSIESVENRLKTRPLETSEQVCEGIKKVVSKSLLPGFLAWREGDDSDTQRVYAIQAGEYDEEIISFCERWKLG